VVDLLKMAIIKEGACLLGVSWDLTKEIYSKYLKQKCSPPSLIGLKNIDIDEFSLRKDASIRPLLWI